MAFQSFVVRTPKHTILIDTCNGKDKFTDAVVGANLIPLLTLGIPGNIVAALLVSAMLIANVFNLIVGQLGMWFWAMVVSAPAKGGLAVMHHWLVFRRWWCVCRENRCSKQLSRAEKLRYSGINSNRISMPPNQIVAKHVIFL